MGGQGGETKTGKADEVWGKVMEKKKKVGGGMRQRDRKRKTDENVERRVCVWAETWMNEIK